MEYLPLLSVVLSVFSLCISLLTYQKFQVREIEKKQIDLVLELIRDLHNHFVILNFTQIKNEFVSNTYKQGSLFSLADTNSSENNLENPMYHMLEKEMPNFSKLKVYVPEDHERIFKVGSYLSNPLLPSKIAHSLNKSFRFRSSFTKRENLEGEFILLQESKLLDSKSLKGNYPLKDCEYYCSNFSNYGEFIEGMKQLKNEIQNWLRSRGLKDLNIYWKEPRYY